MADLTNKLKNRARREEQRENFSAAIELYSRALRATERDGAIDVSLYNRIGDIYLRLEDIDSAIGYYERAILRYADQELFTSAIALCNKVLRVQPSRISAYLQLGRLQLETGLMAEARVNYLRYATELLTRGQSDEAEAALEEYVIRTQDLDSALRFSGALVANDREKEALSLLMRLETRLEALDVDTTPLQRPIAAIRGFEAPSAADDAEPAAAEVPDEAESTEVPDQAEPADVPADRVTGSAEIVDLDAELEAAVEEYRPEASRATQEVEPDAGTTAEPEPSGPVEPEPTAPFGAATADAAAGVDAPDSLAGPEPAPPARPAQPEGPERAEEDARRPRVAPEAAEDADSATPSAAPVSPPASESHEGDETTASPEPPREAVTDPVEASSGSESVLPAEPADAPDAEALESDDAKVVELDERIVSPSLEVVEDPADVAGDAEKVPSFDDASEPSLATPADRGAADGDASAADGPETDVALPASRLASAMPEEDAEFEEPDEESWAARIADGEEAAPDADEPEAGSRAAELAPPPRDLPSCEDPESAAGGPRSLPAWQPDRELPESAPTEPTRLAVARRVGTLEDPVESVELEVADDAAAPDAEEARRSLRAGRELLERGELEQAIAELERAAESPVCVVEAYELLEECHRRSEMRQAAEAETRQAAEAEMRQAAEAEMRRAAEAEGLPPLESTTPVEPGLEVDGAEEVEAEPEPEAKPPLDVEPEPEPVAGPTLAVEPEPPPEVEAAPEVELERDAEPESEAETEPLVAPEPVGEVEVAPEPAVGSPVEPDVEREQLEQEPASREEPDAGPAIEVESLPEAAVGPGERSRGSWLLATAQDSAGAIRDDGSQEAEAERPVGGRPPDEPFRLWLAASSFEVLKRALEELERREELQRALCVVERMLELQPEDASLHRVRIAHAAELGREEVLPGAYMDLAALLEASGQLVDAYGAYERVHELDPERPELATRMREVERRCAEAGVDLSAAPAEVEAEDAEEARTAGEVQADRPRHGGEDASGAPDTSMPGVHVYRGVVQDLQAEAVGVGPEAALDAAVGGATMEGTVDFDVILSELKDQLAERVVDEPDGRSRTEVGERLMEMGLLDDAIRELQAAVRGPDAPPRAFELLGRAFIEKGQPRVASRLLEEALDKLSDEVAEEALLGVLYQLGVACQESDEAARALTCYERIFSVDIDYRDVRERIEACAA